MRLDKLLVEIGLGSRTEVKALLKKKTISVNGKVETSPKWQVEPKADQIDYQGKPLKYEKFLYYMLNKPAGVISATEDKQHRTVLDLLDEEAQHRCVFPVGRLDIDTEGLLLLTNNGQLAHEMLSPKKHVNKRYYADVSGVMTCDDQKSFEAGIVLKDHNCLPAQLDILSTDTDKQSSRVIITIQEGKFHQVKRMVKACGKEVTYLKRLTMGTLVLDESLEKGNWRRLTAEEVADLQDLTTGL